MNRQKVVFIVELTVLMICGVIILKPLYSLPSKQTSPQPATPITYVWTPDTTNEAEHLFLTLPPRSEPPTREYEYAFMDRSKVAHILYDLVKTNPTAISRGERQRLANALRTSKPNWPPIFYDVVDSDVALLEGD